MQFKTNRMSDATYLKDVDDNFRDLEDSVVYFFGLITNEPLQGRIMYTDVDGNITSILRQAAAPAISYTTGPGWRSRDTNTGDEYLIGVQDGYLKVFKNIGSQASPAWQLKNTLDLSDGAWSVVSSSDIGTGCAVYSPYGSIDFRTPAFMQYEFELFDDGDYFDSGVDKTKLVIPAAGRYSVQWSAYHGVSGLTVYQVELMTTLYLNGSPVVSFASGRKDQIQIPGPPTKPGLGVGGDWIFNSLSENDYLQFQFQIWSYDDDAIVINQSYASVERIA